MIYILTPWTSLTEYLFANLRGVDTVLYSQKYCIWKRIILCMYSYVSNSICFDLFSRDVSRKIKSIGPEDKIIVIEENSYIIKSISKLTPKVRNKVLFFWNPFQRVYGKVGRDAKYVNGNIEHYLDFCKSLGYSLATFDQQDAKEKGIKFTPQFYRSPESMPRDVSPRTFFFCGLEKGRGKVLSMFDQKLSPFGKCEFLIVGQDGVGPMTYREYLSRLLNAEVICEVLQSNQTGLSLRTVEALFLKKKLITNNHSIKEYDFYNPSNILVLDEFTRDSDIERFLDQDYCPVSDEIYGKYDVMTWCRSI